VRELNAREMGPRVRIRFAPAVSQQTFGASQDDALVRLGATAFTRVSAFAYSIASDLVAAAVRVGIGSRSTSARPPRTASINHSVLVPVSAHGSASDRNYLRHPTEPLFVPVRST
jgi:hypothetical protein